MRRPLVPLVSALAVLLLASACGDSGAESPSTTRTTEKPTTTTQPTTTTTTQPAALGIAGAAPLTGLPMNDPAVATRKAVVVKIDNVDGKSRPQVGINSADLVYEIQVEGGVTRFMSVFQSEEAAPVGPVRSARGSEIPALEELNLPIFVWHGANDILKVDVRSAAIIRGSIDDIPGVFYRERTRPSPYNSFVRHTADVRAAAGQTEGAPPPLFWYRTSEEGMNPHAVPASSVSVRWPAPFGGSANAGEAPSTWNWDAAAGEWKRSQMGTPHVDSNGQQIGVANVIVRFVTAVDSGTIDKAGSRVPTAQLTGEGEAWVFTGGKVIVGRWIKPDGPTPTRYVDAAGSDIRLAPGQTWISLPYGPGSTYG